MEALDTQLLDACEAGDARLAAKIIAKGANPSARSDRIETRPSLVAVACEQGHHALLRTLVLAGADVDAADSKGWTPLMNCALWLSSGSSLECARILIQAGCSLDLAQDGSTATHFAAKFGGPEILAELIGAGADLDARDHFGQTPLVALMSSVSDERSTSMCDDDLRDLDDAFCHDCARLLIDAGCSLDLADHSGATAAHEAAKGNFASIVALLAERGANLDATDLPDDNDLAWTPLMHAAAEGHAEAVAALLARGADPSILDEDGDDAESIATINDHHHCAAMIRAETERRALSACSAPSPRNTPRRI